MNQFGFALSDAGEVLDLDIYSVIGESMWWDAVSATAVRRQLKASKAKTVNLRINSEGGDIFDASDIYDQLKAHAARKVVRIGGLAASAASFVAMAGDEIVMGPGAWMMIHNPWGGAQGSAEKLQGWADTLLKARDMYAAVYAARSGQPKDKVLEMMAAETWLTAEEAVKLGFADRVDGSLASPADVKVKARSARAFAAASLNDFANVPEAVRALMTTARGELEQERQPAPPAPEPTTPPAPEARKPTPANLGEENNMALSKLLITALALTDDADETAAAAAIARLKASAKVGSDIEQLLGVTGQSALGAVRALKEGNEANADLGVKVAQLQIVNVRRDFEATRDGGTKDKKLTPAVAKLYNERFEAAIKLAQGEEGDADAAAAKAQDIVADLKGFLAVAPRVVSASIGAPPVGGTGGGGDQPIAHNGKAFEAMKGSERKALKDADPAKYDLMREDAVARGAL